MKPMSKVDIINDTVEFYSKNPRALDERGVCTYLNNNGERCAIGRFSVSKELDRFQGDFVVFLFEEDVDHVDSVLDPRVHGHSDEFWQDLQTLHDSGVYWSAGKLTEEGTKYKNILLKQYGSEA